MGPSFFDSEAVNGEKYLALFEHKLWPEISDHDDIDRVFFLHDGTAAHYALAVQNWLDNKCNDRWIGRWGPMQWPARSCDMTSLDFWLWGYLKDRVYATKPRSIDQLKCLIIEKMAEIPPEIIANVCDSVTRRMHRCTELKGHQIADRLI